MNNLVKEDLKTIIEGVGVPINDLQDSTVLLTGSCGFLGSWFISVIRKLNENYFEKPCKVVAIDSFIATDSQNLLEEIKDDKNINFIKGDISDKKFFNEIRESYREQIQYIIHAAGIASPIYYRKYPIETIDGMVLGLRWLLEYAASFPVASFLYFSSSEMYGNPHADQVPTKETYNGNVSAIGPRACYDEAKRLGETYCSVYHRIHDIPVKWVRPFNVYGPGMRRKDDRVAPKFMYQALTNEPITVHVPGVQTRTLCYITDAMIGFFKAMLIGKNGEVYNIGYPSGEITMRDLAYLIEKIVGKKLNIQEIEMPTEYPQDQAQRRCPDITKAFLELNYAPKISLVNGLEKLYSWCKSNLQ